MAPKATAATSAASPRAAAAASPPPPAALVTGEALVTLAAARDAGAFVDLLRAELERGRGQYRVLLLRLRDERALLQAQPEHATAFILDCLAALLPAADKSQERAAAAEPSETQLPPQRQQRQQQRQPPQSAPARASETAAHLLLDLAPSCTDRVAGPGAAAARSRAAGLLERVMEARGAARPALKIAQAFRLQYEDVEGFAIRLADWVAYLTEDTATATPAVGLLLHFKELQARFDVPAALGSLVAQRHHGLAEDWAASLGRDQQVALVEHCVEADDLKQGVAAGRRFGILATSFPGLERAYRRRTVGRLAGKRQWSVAAAVAGEDAELQELLVLALVEAGEPALAETYRAQFRLPASLVDTSAGAVAAAAAARAAAHLALDLPEERVRFVDGRAQLDSAAALLEGAPVLGLDCEWQPDGGGTWEPHGVPAGKRAPVSVLQVASTDAVVVFDLLALGKDPALDACLSRIFLGAGSSGNCGKGHDGGRAQNGAGPALCGQDGQRASSAPDGGSRLAMEPDGSRAQLQQGVPGRISPAAAGDVEAAADAAAAHSQPAAGAGGQPSAALGSRGPPPPLGQPPLKVGVGLGDDLRRLAATHPGVAAFRHIPRALDLRCPWRELQARQASSRVQRGAVVAGLSAMALRLLGKPLDKSQQVSAWGSRPLTAAQLRYAALDAHAAVRIHAALLDRGVLLPEQLKGWCFDHTA